MKKKCISILAAVVFTISMVVTLCGCDKRVDGNSITVGEMTIELPDGEWRIDGDKDSEDYISVYDKDIGTLQLCKKDNPDSYIEHYGYPIIFCRDNDILSSSSNHKIYFLNGYRTELSIDDNGLTLAIRHGINDYYFAEFTPNEPCDNPEKISWEIVKSSAFKFHATKGYYVDEDEHIISWTEADSIAKELYSDGVEEFNGEMYGIRGTVKKVTTSNGNTFVDIGEAYPDPNRVTGVLWKEDAKWYDGKDLDYYKGKEVFLIGEIYQYQGSANVSIGVGGDISEIIDLDDVDSLDDIR